MSTTTLTLLGQALLMLLASSAIAAAVLGIVSGLRPQRLATPPATNTHEQLDRLVHLAVIAERSGIEAAARHAATTAIGPVLARAARGEPVGIEALHIEDAQTELERYSAAASRRLVTGSIAIISALALMAFGGLVLLLIVPTPAASSALIAAACVLALVAMPLLSATAMRAVAVPTQSAGEALSRAMSLEAAELIARGASSLAVREALVAMLPPSQRPQRLAARAA